MGEIGGGRGGGGKRDEGGRGTWKFLVVGWEGGCA